MSQIDYKFIDPKVLSTLLAHSKNKQLGHELVEIFAQDARKLIESFNEACAIQNHKSLSYLTHRMKGSCLNVGATRLHVLCENIESSATDSPNWQKVESLISSLSSDLTACLEEFQHLLKSH